MKNSNNQHNNHGLHIFNQPLIEKDSVKKSSNTTKLINHEKIKKTIMKSNKNATSKANSTLDNILKQKEHMKKDIDKRKKKKKVKKIKSKNKKKLNFKKFVPLVVIVVLVSFVVLIYFNFFTINDNKKMLILEEELKNTDMYKTMMQSTAIITTVKDNTLTVTYDYTDSDTSLKKATCLFTLKDGILSINTLDTNEGLSCEIFAITVFQAAVIAEGKTAADLTDELLEIKENEDTTTTTSINLNNL